MKISIIIPTYNRPKHLLECLESCINQTCPPFEIIVGDDSSNSESEKIVASLDYSKAKLIYTRNVPALGQGKNVGNLMRRASGDLICLIHDDDKLSLDNLEKLSPIFKTDQEVIISFGKQFIISDDGKLDQEASDKLNVLYSRTHDKAGIQSDILKSAILQQIPNNGFLVRAECAKKVDHESLEKKYFDGADFGFALELAQAYRKSKALFLDQYTAFYRNSTISIARGGPPAKLYISFHYQSQLAHSVYKLDSDISKFLKKRSSVAIFHAIHWGDLVKANEWILSKYYRKKIFSLGGVRMVLFYAYKKICLIFSTFIK